MRVLTVARSFQITLKHADIIIIWTIYRISDLNEFQVNENDILYQFIIEIAATNIYYGCKNIICISKIVNRVALSLSAEIVSHTQSQLISKICLFDVISKI
jgi:hypothetical protein